MIELRSWARFTALAAIAFLSFPIACRSVHGAIVQEAYLKASNTGFNDQFARGVAVWGDTVVVGAPNEDSSAAGVNGNQNDNNLPRAGAVYVFVREGNTWTQQAYLKASNPGLNDQFGHSVALWEDTLVIGAIGNGTINDPGAAYVFVRTGTNWTQQAYLEASNPGRGDEFGWSVAAWGDTLVVGAFAEDSGATGVNGNQNDNSRDRAGAAYVFVRNGTNWTQQAYLKASNTDANDSFGASVAISGDTVVVGAIGEDSAATGVNGDQNDNSSQSVGAAYAFVRNGTTWSQQAYLKASTAGFSQQFGYSVGVSGDTIVAGAILAGASGDPGTTARGEAYVFVRSGTVWSEQAVLKASNAEALDIFGRAVAISGETIVVSSDREDSGATGVNGDQNNNDNPSSGAAYVFVRSGTTWNQQAYLKASNTGTEDFFGTPLAIWNDIAVIGAPGEDSSATGVNGNQHDDSLFGAGAAYIFVGLGIPPDSDDDGVLNPDDQCPNTPPGAIVDATGCSIGQLAPCDGPWRNHGHYVNAVRDVTSDFVAAGLMTEEQQHALHVEAARSDCGKKPKDNRGRD